MHLMKFERKKILVGLVSTDVLTQVHLLLVFQQQMDLNAQQKMNKKIKDRGLTRTFEPTPAEWEPAPLSFSFAFQFSGYFFIAHSC